MGVLVPLSTIPPHSLCPGEDKPDEGLLQEASEMFIPVLSEAERFTWADKRGLKLAANSSSASVLLWKKLVLLLPFVLLFPLITPNLAQRDSAASLGRERGLRGARPTSHPGRLAKSSA